MTTPKFYEVELRWTAVVQANSEMEAYDVAEDEKRDICGDVGPDVDVMGEIKSLTALPVGWDRKCLPYGGDGERRLEELLPEEEPVRDTLTIDMFAEQQS